MTFSAKFVETDTGITAGIVTALRRIRAGASERRIFPIHICRFSLPWQGAKMRPFSVALAVGSPKFPLRFWTAAALFACTALLACGGEGGASGATPPTRVAPRQIIVRFAEGVTQNQIETINARYRVRIIKSLRGNGLYLLQIPEGMTVEQAVHAYGALPEVKYAEPNYVQRID